MDSIISIEKSNVDQGRTAKFQESLQAQFWWTYDEEYKMREQHNKCLEISLELSQRVQSYVNGDK